MCAKNYYTIEDVKNIRDDTAIGSYIKFKHKNTVNGYKKTVKGTVIKKYNNIFILDNGKSYMWKEYLIGL